MPVAAAVAAAVAADVTAPAQQQQVEQAAADGKPKISSPAEPSISTALMGDGAQKQQLQSAAAPAAAAATAVEAEAGPVQRPPAADALSALGVPYSEAQTLGALELLVDGFELDK